METAWVAAAAFAGGWFAHATGWHKKLWNWLKEKWENRK